ESITTTGSGEDGEGQPSGAEAPGAGGNTASSGTADVTTTPGGDGSVSEAGPGEPQPTSSDQPASSDQPTTPDPVVGGASISAGSDAPTEQGDGSGKYPPAADDSPPAADTTGADGQRVETPTTI